MFGKRGTLCRFEFNGDERSNGTSQQGSGAVVVVAAVVVSSLSSFASRPGMLHALTEAAAAAAAATTTASKPVSAIKQRVALIFSEFAQNFAGANNNLNDVTRATNTKTRVCDVYGLV